jgi:glutaredoxin-like protein NrdH
MVSIMEHSHSLNPSRRNKMQVTVYTLPSCQQCEMTKKMLVRGAIEFDVVDLSEDEQATQLVQSLGYSSAPVVIAGEHHWSGFRHGALQNLIQMIHGEEAKAKLVSTAA